MCVCVSPDTRTSCLAVILTLTRSLEYKIYRQLSYSIMLNTSNNIQSFTEWTLSITLPVIEKIPINRATHGGENKRPTGLYGHLRTVAIKQTCLEVSLLHFKIHYFSLKPNPRLLWQEHPLYMTFANINS